MRRFQCRRLPADDAGTPDARRGSAEAPRRAVHSNREFLLLPGWVTECTLAEGREAHVLRVHRTGDPERRPFAAKVLRRRGPDGERYSVTAQRRRLVREVRVLRSLEEARCPYVPRVVTFGLRTATSPRPWYVIPYYAGGAMWQKDRTSGQWAEAYRGNVDRVLEIAEALAVALAVMHEGPRRCIHRNVSADNVLFATPRGLPVLGGFSMALVAGYSDRPLHRRQPSPRLWRPPGFDCADAYRATPASDVFMLGGLIYEALSGGRLLPPATQWTGPGMHELPEHSLLQDSSDPRVELVSALLCRMLAANPRGRLSAREVARRCRAARVRPPAGILTQQSKRT